MTQSQKKEPTEKFIGYPTNKLFSVINNRNIAQKAVEALEAAGFKGEIELFHGVEGADRIDATGAKHGRLAQLRRLHQNVTVEREHAERYEQAVLRGHCVIAVHIKDSEQREHARRILLEHDGHFINFYGRFGIRKLDL